MIGKVMGESNLRGRDWSSVTIQGVTIDAIGVGTLHRYIGEIIRDGGKSRVLNVNVRAMNLAARQTWFHEALNDAEVVFCDGAGIQLAARMLGCPAPPRITYASWIWNLAEYCESEDFSIFLLGAREGVAEQAALCLSDEYPDITISGCHHGYFDHFGEEAERVVQMINAQSPDILLVCFGMPLQEKWIASYWRHLDASIFLAGGACLDYASGEAERGPKWMTDYGLEWLDRLAREPGRLWRRNLRAPLFFGRVVREAIGRLMSSS